MSIIEINCGDTPFLSINLNKNLLSNSTKNVSMKAMHLTNVNFVIKDFMEKQISIGILLQFMRKIKPYERNLWNVICDVIHFNYCLL
jgi:hypothetical protein